MSVLRRVLNLFRDDRLSADAEREMAFHLDERVDELMHAGMNRPEAEAEARRRFGNRTVLKERTRDADLLGWLASVRDDVRYALRGMRGAPGFTAVAVLSLALGIGANTAIFTLVDAVVLRTLPVRNPSELFVVSTSRPSQGERSNGGTFTNPIWEAVRTRGDGIGRLFAFGTRRFNLASSGEVNSVDGVFVSGEYFTVLGVVPTAGRLLAPSDDVRGCPALAVVSAGFATRRMGSVAAALGWTLTLEGHPFTVVGVTEPAFSGTDVGTAPAVFAPICAEPIVDGNGGVLDRRGTWWLNIMGRLAPGQALDATRSQLAAIAPDVNQATLPPWNAGAQRRYLARTLWAEPAAGGNSDLRLQYRDALTVLFVVVGVVLLIACANVANLLLARATARQREMAVRLSLGAGRGRLVRQLLTESLLLAGCGAVLGIVFARWASALLVAFLVTRRDAIWLDLHPDLRILGFTVGIAAVTGILFGVVPAWRATRVNPHAALKAQGRGTTSARLPVARALVALQIALSLVLVVAAGLLVGTFRRLITMPSGFQRDGVLVANVDFSTTGLDTAGQRRLLDDLLGKLRALPGVRSAAVSFTTPIAGWGWNEQLVADADTVLRDPTTSVYFNGVSPRWFATLGTALRAGRDFTDDDRPGAVKVAIVNETMARTYYPGQSPLGRTFRIARTAGGYDPPLEVVGVVEDAKYGRLTEKPQAIAYVPVAQTEWISRNGAYELRVAGGDPMALAPQVTAAALAENRHATADFVTLEAQIAESVRRPRLLATVSGFFGALALLLAVVGLYGTMAYGVAQRRNEIGIRLALGAARARILRMVLSEAGTLVGTGVIVGLVASLLATRLVATFLYGVERNDPVTLGASVLALGAVALMAAAIPAWRAASLDPAETLRAD